jgi:uncharacterized RDD family membrane protein YckC
MERDRLELTTPEGVTLDLELAGVGSRALAGTLDLIIQAMIMYGVIVVMLVGAFAGGGNPFLVIAASILAVVAAILGYHVVFEVWVGGQTPGKRMIGLRVVRTDGGPVGLAQSLIRTLMRIIDFLPTIYAIGIVTVFATTRNQRLGDLAAGTVVILDRSRHPKPVPTSRPTTPMSEIVGNGEPASASVPVGWDVSAVTDEEVGLVRRFLDRRWSLDDGARRALAADLAARLRTKVVAPESFVADEPFLAQIVRIKDGPDG